MKFYTSLEMIGNRLLLREVVDGIPSMREVDWTPELFVRSNTGSDFVSLFDEPVKRVEFGSLREAKDYVKEYSEVDGVKIYGQLNWRLQYLNQYYMDGWKYDQVKVFSIDIETKIPDTGFPNPLTVDGEIVLITVQNVHDEGCVTFGAKPYRGEDTDYRYCPDERTLLSEFILYVATERPDVFTGWNIDGFDIPYIVNRIRRVLGDTAVKSLSPWGIVNVEERTYKGKKGLNVSIVGVSCLDYLSLMKKFTYGGRDSWALGSVAQEELGHTKLDYSEYDGFMDFMERDWEKFVRYNIIDARLVTALDRKMQLIVLALTMAYRARVNYNDVFSPVKTWDAIIHNALYAKKIAIPQRQSGNDFTDEDSHIEGAYVKDPIPGFYELMASIDATSLYPTIMEMLNLSPETYRGQLDSTVEICLQGIYPPFAKEFAMGANGSLFSKEKQGIIPTLIREYMGWRKTAKNEMLRLQQEYEKTKDEKLQSRISALNNEQMAAKILMNSLYGALANKGFRFFHSDVAECITTTGQLYLRSIDKFLPPMMSKAFGIKEKDYVVYADTDSLYIWLEEVIRKFVPPETEITKVIKVMEKVVQDKIQPMVASICTEVAQKLNVYKDNISFKLEIAADKVIFTKKKKYVCRVYSSEGVTYAKPKFKVMGLEMVRSSTPGLVRDKLRESLDLIFDKDEKTIQKFVSETKEMFMGRAIEEVAFPRGAKNLDKYSDKDTIYGAKTPMHVRAALLYNRKIEDLNLKKKYKLIQEGDKIKFVYLREPNPLRENTIAWPADEHLPKEFKIDTYVDYEVQFEKAFLSSLNVILDAIKWSAVEQSSLEEFFG